MIKVFFTSYHFQTPQTFLNTIIKMTPGNSGRFKNIEAVTDINSADYYIIMDGANHPLPNAEKKAIYFGQHPTGLKSFKDWKEQPALLRLSLDKFLCMGEYWISHSYDELTALQPPNKTKELLCVCTGHTHLDMYAQRLKFLEAYCEKYNNLDLYGRPQENYNNNQILKPFYRGVLGHKYPDGTKGEHLQGKEILLDYKYSIEFDVGPTKNYFSERFYDALLLWTFPIYFGSNNVHEFIPKEAFTYIDPWNLSDINKVDTLVKQDVRKDNLAAIAKARDLLLNKYQLWAYTNHVVNNIGEFVNNPNEAIRKFKI